VKNQNNLWLLAGLVLALVCGQHARAADTPAPATAHAIFAGGCFWCMEPPFDALPGVTATTSGYTGGHVVDPTYKQVSAGATGHREAVEITYDPAKVSYAKLLDTFWHNIDPFDASGQFCDHGEQYTSAIFYADEAQKHAAEESKAAVEKKFNKHVATAILPARTFYPAEDYHQDYYKKNELRYKFYRYSCGRDQRLEEVWGESPH